jgi:hypothetical protein
MLYRTKRTDRSILDGVEDLKMITSGGIIDVSDFRDLVPIFYEYPTAKDHQSSLDFIKGA